MYTAAVKIQMENSWDNNVFFGLSVCAPWISIHMVWMMSGRRRQAGTGFVLEGASLDRVRRLFASEQSPARINRDTLDKKACPDGLPGHA